MSISESNQIPPQPGNTMTERESKFLDQDEALVMWDTFTPCLASRRLLWWQSNFKVGFENYLEDMQLW